MTPDAWIRLRSGRRSMVVSAAVVRQVLPAREVTRVPLTWPHIAGVLVTGGGAVPVCSFALLPVAGAPPGESTSQEKEIVIIEQDGVQAGILVERADRMERPPERPDLMIDGRVLLLAAGLLAQGADGQTAAQAAEGEI